MRPIRLILGAMFAVCFGAMLTGCGEEIKASASQATPDDESQAASLADDSQIASASVSKPSVKFPEKHAAFLDAYCMDCHDADTEKGSVNLEALSFQIETIEQAETWQNVLNALNSGEMPPEKKKQHKRIIRILLSANVYNRKFSKKIKSKNDTRSKFIQQGIWTRKRRSHES